MECKICGEEIDGRKELTRHLSGDHDYRYSEAFAAALYDDGQEFADLRGDDD